MENKFLVGDDVYFLTDEIIVKIESFDYDLNKVKISWSDEIGSHFLNVNETELGFINDYLNPNGNGGFF